MLKQMIFNKRETVENPSLEFERRYVELAEFRSLQGDTIEDIARTSDQSRIHQLSARLVTINSAISVLSAMEDTKAQIEVKKKEIQQTELRIAGRGQETFTQNCREIVLAVLERELKLTHPGCTSESDMRHWIGNSRAYFRKLITLLSYENAEKQASEIVAAGRERRPWIDHVRLPKPEKVSVRLLHEENAQETFSSFSNSFEQMYEGKPAIVKDSFYAGVK